MTGKLRSSLHKSRDWLARQLAVNGEESYAPAAPSGSRRIVLIVTCAAIFFVALTVRLLHWQDSGVELALKNSIMHTLGAMYDDEAHRIINEGGLLIPNTPVEQGDAWMIVHPPGYSILMAGLFSLFGETESLMRMTRVVSSSAGAVILFFIAAEMSERIECWR
jgi:hypothetical protein